MPSQVIRHPEQLSGLSVFARRSGPVAIEDGKLPVDTLRLWEREINVHYLACGCRFGAAVLAAAVAAYLVWMALRPDDWVRSGWGDLWVGGGGAIAAAVLGKMLGLWLAQRRLSANIKTIQGRWSAYCPAS